MKVGDYVRTINGEIYKLIDDFALIYFQKEQEHGIPEHQIIKSSPNIIDLIEVGDYVNGGQVREIEKDYIRISGGGYIWQFLKKEEIKSIATKEQFKNIEYEVEE